MTAFQIQSNLKLSVTEFVNLERDRRNTHQWMELTFTQHCSTIHFSRSIRFKGGFGLARSESVFDRVLAATPCKLLKKYTVEN